MSAEVKKQGLPATVRALWVVRTSITCPEAVRRVAELAQQYGFNALFVQVRGRGDAYYQSSYEPRAEPLAGQSKDFDPLALLLHEAHRRGLQVHAWLNLFYIWNEPHQPLSPQHILNRHPEWIARDKRNQWRMTGDSSVEGAYLCPSHPQVRQHLLKVYQQVAQNYEVDGIHLDYVRYPNQEYCYCRGCLGRFRAFMKKRLPEPIRKRVEARLATNRLAYPEAFPKEWDQWRRARVSTLVRLISTRLHQLKPHLILSAAVFANRKEAYEHRFQDWATWLQKGWLDAALPMAYNRDTRIVARQLREAVRIAQSRPIIAGIGAWLLTPEATLEKIQIAHTLRTRGFCLFSYGAITEEGQNELYLAHLALALNLV